MDDARSALILDTDPGELGSVALRMVRTGFSTHYARFPNEAFLLIEQERGRIRTLVVPPEIDAAAAGSVREATQSTSVAGPASMVVVGNQPTDEIRVALRAAGASRALWRPFDDATLRYVMNSAMALPGETSARREPRAPVSLICWLQIRGTRCFGVLYSLSPGGAFIEIPQPLPVGCRLALEFSLEKTAIETRAEVIYRNTREELRAPSLPIGCGLRFEGLASDARAMILDYVTPRATRFEI